MIKDYKFKVPATGAVRPRVTGNYIHFKDTTAPSVSIRVRAYDRESALVVDVNMAKGDDIKLKDYVYIELDNSDASDVDITLLLGDGEDFEAGAAAQTVDVNPYTSLNGIAPLAWTGAQNKTIPANSSRKRITMKADTANPNDIYIGSTDGNSGVPLAAGESVTEDVTGAIETYCNATGNTLHYYEVE